MLYLLFMKSQLRQTSPAHWLANGLFTFLSGEKNPACTTLEWVGAGDDVSEQGFLVLPCIVGLCLYVDPCMYHVYIRLQYVSWAELVPPDYVDL